jgi:ATP adenylyltransferase
MTNDKAHLTAIKRNKVSAPVRWLSDAGLIQGWDILDYGCGRGFDADAFQMEKYDPHYFPTYPTKMYDLIICNYVLNVVDLPKQVEILQNMSNLLKVDGVAFVIVRRDVKQNGFTSRGTYQRNVVLGAPVIKQTATYCIYRLTK